jgi:hypothetical protein
MDITAFIIRILGAVANAFNISKKKSYSNDSANAIANNDDGVLKSDETFADLADKSKSNKPK